MLDSPKNIYTFLYRNIPHILTEKKKEKKENERKEKKRKKGTHHITLVPTGVAPDRSYNIKHMERLKPSVILCICSFPRHWSSIHYENALALFIRTSYLFNVIVQCYDAQRSREVGTPWDGGANRGWLTDEALVRGLLKIWCLVVLVQNFNQQFSIGRKRVTVILLGLFTNKQTKLSRWNYLKRKAYGCYLLIRINIKVQ